MNASPVVKNRVLNNGLTDFATGYRHRASIHEMIFRVINVDHLAGRFRDFEYDGFTTDEDGPKAIDAPYLFTDFQFGEKTFSIQDHGLATSIVDLEEIDADPDLRLEIRKVRNVMRRLSVRQELEAQKLVYAYGSYPAGHIINVNATQRWDQAGSNPLIHIEDAKEAIRKKTGFPGNAIMIPADVLSKMRVNTELIKRFVNVVVDALSLQMISTLIDIPVSNIFIGNRIYNSANKAQDMSIKDIWSTHVLVFLIDEGQEDGEEPEEMVFAAKWRLRNFGNMGTRVVNYESGNPPGTAYVVQSPYGLNVLDYNAGYLIRNAIGNA